MTEESKVSTFDKLKDIQDLTKQLVSIKKIKDEMFEKAEDMCNELYESKIKIVERYDNLSGIKNESSKLTYELSKRPFDVLGEAGTYIPKFLFFLRERIDVVFKIIKLSKTSEEKSVLASFITNFFYENICSSSFVECEFLVILYLSLKDEIEKLEDPTKYKNFLKINESFNYHLAKSLLRKDDIKTYFGIILKEIIDNFENKNDENVEIQLELANILQKIKKSNENANNKNKKRRNSNEIRRCSELNSNKITDIQKTNTYDTEIIYSEKNNKNVINSNNDKDNLESNFIKTYLKNIYKKDLENMLEESIKTNNVKMKEFFEKQLEEYNAKDLSINENENIFSNENFKINLNKIMQKENDNIIFNKYIKNFNELIELLDLLINNLTNSSKIIPYSIKCACKMISILIKKKFPKISVIDHNNMLAEFFLEHLFKPIFIVPDYNGLISNVIVSNSTRSNLIILYKIFKNLAMGYLYNANNGIDADFTPLNSYFIEKMPKIFDFFDKITNVKLPKILDKIINGEIDEHYLLYDHFKEYKSDFMNYCSICFSLNDVLAIYNIINKNESEFINSENTLKLSKIFLVGYDKLKSIYIRKLEETRQKEIDEKIKKFVLVTQTKYNKDMENIIEILDNKNFKSFSFFELPNPEVQRQLPKDILSLKKVKNFLTKILFSFKHLSEDILTSDSIKSTEEIIESIQIFLQTDYYLVSNVSQNIIPLHWYGKALLTLLKEIPEEYKLNDYEKLYTEIYDELIIEKNKLDFQCISEIKTKFKYTEKELDSSKKCLDIINQIELINQIKKFFDNVTTACTIRLEYKNKEDDIENIALDLPEEVQDNKNSKSNLKGIFKFLGGGGNNDKKKNLISKEISIKNIYEFLNAFPNLIDIQKSNEFELLNYIDKLKVKDIINKYLTVINHQVDDNKNLADSKQKVYREICNFVSGKLNSKILPSKQEVDDLKVYQNCIFLSWIEPKHLGINIPNEGGILDNYLTEINKYMTEFHSQKGIYGKITCLNKMKQLILQTIAYSTGNMQSSTDDSNPFLEYALIKCQPKMLSSNIKYINMFLSADERKGVNGKNTQDFELMCEKLKDYKHYYLNGITEEEFREMKVKSFNNLAEK